MSTVEEYRAKFQTYNPSGGGVEEWNMWCQAFVARMSKMGGGFVRDFLTARAARLASGWLNTDLSAAPVGAVGYWLWGTDDHVAVYEGGGVWLMGSRHVTDRFGGVSRNAGRVSHDDFQRTAGLKFLGWAATNGGNRIPITSPAPTPSQRKVGSVAVNVRVSPIIGARIIRVEAPGAIKEISGFVTNGSLANGSSVWYEVAGAGWSSAASFTEIHGHNLTDKTPTPEPVVPEPVVPEPVVPEPVVPEPVVPEPSVPEPSAPSPSAPSPSAPSPVVPEPVVPEPVVPEPVAPAPNWSWWAGLVSLLVSLLAAIRSKPKP
jgi:hypothetical protein